MMMSDMAEAMKITVVGRAHYRQAGGGRRGGWRTRKNDRRVVQVQSIPRRGDSQIRRDQHVLAQARTILGTLSPVFRTIFLKQLRKLSGQ